MRRFTAHHRPAVPKLRCAVSGSTRDIYLEQVPDMTEANQPAEPADDCSNSITLVIYRELRIGMVVIMLMLAAAVLAERFSATGWQLALSEYYYTSAHSIFIAALLALSTLFFVYKGSSDTEDALLTLAGVAALLAALVPQGRPPVFGHVGFPSQREVDAVVVPNVWAVVAALVVGWVITLGQRRFTDTRRPARSTGGTLALYLLRLIVSVGLITLIFFRDTFIAHAHGAAGLFMLSAFIGTVCCAAYVSGRDRHSTLSRRRFYQGLYRVIAALMWVTLIGVVTLHFVRPNWFGGLSIIILETALILEFAVYWVVQSIELWNTPDPSDRLPKKTGNRSAEVSTEPARKRLRTELAQARSEPPGQRLVPLL